MTFPPRVTVLIAAYNVAETLPRAIASALSQSVSDIEVIVIDDCSTDQTRRIATDMTDRTKRITVLGHESNMGPGAARTLGLARASGDWIAVLDADDTMAPDRIANLLTHAEAHNLHAVADNLALIDPGDGTRTGTAFPKDAGEALTMTLGTFLANTIPGGRVNLGWMQPLVRRDFLQSHGIRWPDARHAEDMVFMLHLLQSGARMHLLGDPLYHYTQRRGSRTGVTSAHSRTRRSAAEQIRAITGYLDGPGRSLPAHHRNHLLRFGPEAETTACILDARDAVDRRHLLAAAGHAMRALARPAALLRCLNARYGPRSRGIRIVDDAPQGRNT